jgi:glutamine cyclotransferase
MRRLNELLLLALLCAAAACGPAGASNNSAANGPAANTNSNGGTSPAPAAPAAAVPVYGYDVVKAYPHDAAAFTQGLIFMDGELLESTGGYEGKSSLRRVELETGKVLQKVEVPRFYFAEGLTVFGGKAYQLTWEGEKGFVYDPKTFKKLGEFEYEGEGWGLTHDSDSLILSDGSHKIRFIDPNTFQVKRTISVFDNGRPLSQLNELEYVKGEIFANVWHQDRVARIDPQTGAIKGWVDLAGLLRPGEVKDPEAVLNGIAYDEAGDRLFVTGKLWPKLFEVRLKQK